MSKLVRSLSHGKVGILLNKNNFFLSSKPDTAKLTMTIHHKASIENCEELSLWWYITTCDVGMPSNLRDVGMFLIGRTLGAYLG